MTERTEKHIEWQDVERSPASEELVELGAASTETRGNYAGLIKESSLLPWRLL